MGAMGAVTAVALAAAVATGGAVEKQRSTASAIAQARACAAGPHRNRCIVNALKDVAANAGRTADDEAVLRLLGLTYRSMGDRANALWTYQRLLRLFPNTAARAQLCGYIRSQGASCP